MLRFFYVGKYYEIIVLLMFENVRINSIVDVD
jgi:hypothetical protein